MSKTIFRIFEVIEHLGLSARKFDISIGAANGYSLRMKKNNASVGTDVIERIIKQYPKINLVWLITGKGTMFIEEQSTSDAITKHDIDAFIKEKLNDKWNAEKQELLDEIISEIEQQKNKL